jgi:hypothetical protein
MNMRRASSIFIFAGIYIAALSAFAQEDIVSPAEIAKDRAAHEKNREEVFSVNPDEAGSPAAVSQPESEQTKRYRSWEAPAAYSVTVSTKALREEELIGEYKQPRWSAKRRFPTTRIYVVPEGKMGLEWWLEAKSESNDGEPTRIRNQYEFEMGLGHRLQFDIYLAMQQMGIDQAMQLHREKMELRYAFADWGEVWGNPTIYLEFIRQHEGPPKGEAKLLLGGEITSRLHWGTNLVYETELLGEEHENEYKITYAISYTLADEIVSLGAEAVAETVDVKEERFGFRENELLIGPSLSWHPQPPMSIMLLPLVGAALHRPESAPSSNNFLIQTMFIAGWEF